MRFKKTEVCQTCSKMKNVCQTCLLDLEYGLPTQVRDAALGLTEEIPTSDVNREYFIQNQERALAEAGGLTPVGQLAKATKGHELLKKLARTTPYYKRNRAHICSFWVKGECKRGAECPYRHELPTDPNDPLAKQNMKDRYYGTNDPVAAKMMKRASKQPALDAPADQSIMSLFVGGVEEPFVTQQDLKDFFYQYGEIRVINVMQKSKAALVHFTSRSAAEKAAAAATQNQLIIKGRKMKVLWGRSSSGQRGGGKPGGALAVGAAPAGGAPALGEATGEATGGAFVMPPLPPGAMAAGGGGGGRGGYYPSQDPQRLGSRSAQPMLGTHQKPGAS